MTKKMSQKNENKRPGRECFSWTRIEKQGPK